jgi:hypothetical protein
MLTGNSYLAIELYLLKSAKLISTKTRPMENITKQKIVVLLRLVRGRNYYP